MLDIDIYYAGIGSREVPLSVYYKMRRIGAWLACAGLILRSGAAAGSDEAFESGAMSVAGAKTDIWLPSRGFNKHHSTNANYPTPAHFEVAATVHPYWDGMRDNFKKLHARNIGQVLGQDLNTPVAFVVCWTPDGCVNDKSYSKTTGGTGTAIKLASRRGIPVFNLSRPDAEQELYLYVKKLLEQTPKSKPKYSIDFDTILDAKFENKKDWAIKALTTDIVESKPLSDNAIANLQYVLRYVSFIADTVDLCQLSELKVKATYFQKFMARIPPNCEIPADWQSFNTELPEVMPWDTTPGSIAPAINIFSGARGIGGALTNYTTLAKSKGSIKNDYPVVINERKFVDAEEAYNYFKAHANDDYNDGLLIDIIALKFLQNPTLLNIVIANGGVAWLEKCSHFTNSGSAGQAWEGQGYGSRFIRVLTFGFKKALTGRGPRTRVVHVEHAPYDVYIGRDMTSKNPKYEPLGWGNEFRLPKGNTHASLKLFSEALFASPDQLAKVKMLQGRTIGCWCKDRKNLDQPCHGEVYAAIADGLPYTPPSEKQQQLF